MKTNAGSLKKGEFIRYQGDIWQVQKADFYSPGKGSALMKARIKNIISAKNIEYAFKSNEEIETLEVECVEMQYLYKDTENVYFMDQRTYNQFSLPLDVIGEPVKFLKEGKSYFVYVHEEKALTMRPALSVKLKIIETDAAVKGDTVSGAKKPAKVETGVTVMVPLFVKVGDLITVNPETGEYGERVKE
ncbi:elongation factor P [Candidatus Roizmanbacteria bacterium RIFOXYB2_FULL_38_10]|uniref:Elongation factor P n=1 Tax=Candidatus Roizmanbacteria bacterium RIFOXYD1_FULL_38_12 TaxID=1802093 RepID=A0A1F7KZU1_9BACT|nr:MAG: elongation factor P [Candidatus Roizmanbacteria bacterium RIFOXYA2_FULL_38_14]OGK63358.1 MAG: elongation factor P [Candidatus Roizmanbacteria bacterium RIFOXYA1_FULL_37_12]OGK65204.1 MAG: elongation factor P [Candidatus Roizmanbacteria bacterium RIFOXYB1_FULL_40_23]OGK68757.1 MAG: elongation factor P [Candidatus Roizmanbacteria bacterium RIFOXYB2_FULL_38_10]OGK69609.1 MAG: elongation factor P [Candidatus Roizmanbacteria bacterium RIFOXYC1_FULL_38_14]OGK72760.1 MAG: elongation factor P 